MSVTGLPKVELHLHLDCSLSYGAVSRLVPGTSYEEYIAEYVAPTPCTGLAEFLTRAQKGLALLQDEAALTLMTEDVFQQLLADNVIYAELRFAPLLHTQRGLSAERVIEVVNAAAERMSRTTGVESRLILCTLRHFTEDQSVRTAELAYSFRGSRVVAIDLAGDEAGFPIQPHIKAYEYAQSHGLYRTAHAGEALGPESVWQTIELFHPTRIGHGARSVEDLALVQHLADRQIHLELCPSSNVQIIPSVGTLAEHPVDRLYRLGVPLNVNTDTRMLTLTSLSREYEEVQRVFRWGTNEFLKTNLMAVKAAFVDDGVKATLRNSLLQSYPSSDLAAN